MPRIQYFVAASLDGFIATPTDDLAWLLQFDGFEGGADSYNAFLAGVGCIVMGGETYAWLMQHEPGRWPYIGTPSYVFTRHEHHAPEGADITYFDAKFDPATQLKQLQNALQSKEYNAWIVENYGVT